MPRFFPPLFSLRAVSWGAILFLPLWYSFLRWFGFLVILFSLIYQGDFLGICQWLLLIYAFFGALYTEKWELDKEQPALRRCWGFGFPFIKKVFPVESNSQWVLRQIDKKTHLLLMADGKTVVVETGSTIGEVQRLKRMGELAASCMRLGFLIQEASH